MAKGFRPTVYDGPDAAYAEQVRYANQSFLLLSTGQGRFLVPTYEAVGVPNRALAATHEWDGRRWLRKRKRFDLTVPTAPVGEKEGSDGGPSQPAG